MRNGRQVNNEVLELKKNGLWYDIGTSHEDTMQVNLLGRGQLDRRQATAGQLNSPESPRSGPS